jgi:hypothetical protein
MVNTPQNTVKLLQDIVTFLLDIVTFLPCLGKPCPRRLLPCLAKPCPGRLLPCLAKPCSGRLLPCLAKPCPVRVLPCLTKPCPGRLLSCIGKPCPGRPLPCLAKPLPYFRRMYQALKVSYHICAVLYGYLSHCFYHGRCYVDHVHRYIYHIQVDFNHVKRAYIYYTSCRIYKLYVCAGKHTAIFESETAVEVKPMETVFGMFSRFVGQTTEISSRDLVQLFSKVVTLTI